MNCQARIIASWQLLPKEASDALEAVLGLGIDLRSDGELHSRALAMAGKLGPAAAYDAHHVAHYLALAERLGVEFWTADRRLQQAVGATLPWVRLLEA
jgi:predicted nucleic acid-binding protein